MPRTRLQRQPATGHGWDFGQVSSLLMLVIVLLFLAVTMTVAIRFWSSTTPVPASSQLAAAWANEPDEPPATATCGYPGCDNIVLQGTKSLQLAAAGSDRILMRPCPKHVVLNPAQLSNARTALIHERIKAIDPNYPGAQERRTALLDLLATL